MLIVDCCSFFSSSQPGLTLVVSKLKCISKLRRAPFQHQHRALNSFLGKIRAKMGQKLITINRRRIPRAMPFPLQEPLPKSTVRPYFIGFLLVGFSPILLLVLNNQKGNAVPPHILNQDTGLLEDKEQKKE